MATSQEREQAISAVRNGTATNHQQEIVRQAASQAGSVGDRARDARNGK